MTNRFNMVGLVNCIWTVFVHVSLLLL